jgi:uroporphyrinogen-III decarboxylase
MNGYERVRAAVEGRRPDRIPVMLEMDTAVMAGALGVPVAFPVEEPARTVRPLLERLEDVGSLKPVRVEGYRYLQTCLEAVRLLVESFHGQVYVRGNCDQLALSLATMVRTGTDCLELDYKTDTAAAHAALKDRVTLIGNIDPSGVLRWGDVNKVEAETRALCRAFADTPRFILNAGIPQGTPSENLHALVRVAREFGG